MQDGELREDKREEREEEEIERGSPVGLAVAAMLRRLKVYTHLEEQAEDIFIRVDPEEVNR